MNARLLIAASIVLASFLSLTGLALDKAFQRSAIAGVEERLQTQIYLLLGASELNQEQMLVLSSRLPEARYATPGSGLYARVTGKKGEEVWKSDSSLGLKLPYKSATAVGEMQFEEIMLDGKAYFCMSFQIAWEVDENRQAMFTYQIAESRQAYDIQVNGFRKSMSVWLIVAVIILLAVQGVILRWSLAPLRKLALEISDIEEGRKEAVSGIYPPELEILTRNLNALIRNSQQHLRRYRDALGDLAHSIKTPLAVIRTSMQSGSKDVEINGISEQLQRIDQVVNYQLQKAAASGRSVLATPVEVSPLAEKILNSLDKVYAGKSIRLEMDIEEGLRFLGDEGDLMEILGNLLDNACKWAKQWVMLSASSRVFEGRKHIVLEISDDGPGIPDELLQKVLQRGGRLDSSVEGQGIGLAVVRNLVEELYQGRLTVSRNEPVGARVVISIPQ
jgi:two-component system sensor histidine kinase PhoQ